MRIEQKRFTVEKGWEELSNQVLRDIPQLVLVFGARGLIENAAYQNELQSMYPHSHILLCSSAGEILDNEVSDDTMVLTAIHFEKTNLEFAEAEIHSPEESEMIGKQLAQSLPQDGLTHVMVFSDGLKVNGTALVAGINSILPADTAVTGGLVGDGAEFKKTVIGFDAPAVEGKIVVIGFYGTAIKVGYGSLGGWDPFGIERLITKSKGNVLYELDGKPALKIYEEYLGEEKAKELPGAGLLFPLRLRLKDSNEVVRTILAIDREAQSMTFAGDMPEGVPAMMMKANFDRLIDGASEAGKMSMEKLGTESPDLAILISCIGRKLILRERTEEEIEAVRNILGRRTAIAGFYSYGELCPVAASEKQCELHNQTMTITTFREG